MKPILSIIVPIYNSEKYLERCIDSILSQTFTNFELILVNDGSTDGSGLIAEEYSKKDNRIKLINKKNEGVSIARNIGLQIAKGDFIGFVDSDDYIFVDMYEKMISRCNENRADISICKFIREIDGKLQDKIESESILELNRVEGLRECFKGVLYRHSLSNKVFRKKCFEKIIFPEGRIHEDLSTTYRLVANADKLIYIDYSGYVYVKNENSILTSKYSDKRLQALIAWDEIIEFIDKDYSSISSYVIAAFTYWCIDNYISIYKQILDKEEKRKYHEEILKKIKKYNVAIIKNKVLTIREKVTIFTLKIRWN